VTGMKHPARERGKFISFLSPLYQFNFVSRDNTDNTTFQGSKGKEKSVEKGKSKEIAVEKGKEMVKRVKKRVRISDREETSWQ